MEVGKLRTNSATHIFYFIVDAATPVTPNPHRLKRYFVSTTLDSYVESFYFLVKSLSSTTSDPAMREWHQLYVRVFGTVDFDTFMKNIQTLKMNYFNLDTSEQTARRRVEESEAASRFAPRPGALAVAGGSAAETGLMLVPSSRRESDADAAVELHRLRAELSEVSGKLRVEKNRQQLVTLADADRAAVQYKYEQAMQDAESERLKAADAEQLLRTQMKQMQERIDRLVAQHEAAIADMTAADRHRAASIEDTFLKREKAMQQEFEAAITERDRKLQRASAKIETMEGQIQRLSEQLIESQGDVTKLTLMVQNANIHLQALDETARKQKYSIDTLQAQSEEDKKAIARARELERRLETELVGLRTELSRWQAEAQRYARFTASLQGNLRTLDDTSATASALVRKRLVDALSLQQHLTATNRNQYNYNL